MKIPNEMKMLQINHLPPRKEFRKLEAKWKR